MSLPYPMRVLALSTYGSQGDSWQAAPNSVAPGFCCTIACGLPDAETVDIEM
jgi:hypothetical protein